MRVNRSLLLSVLLVTVLLGGAVGAVPSLADTGDTMSFTLQPNSSYQSMDLISVTVQVLDASSAPVQGSSVSLALSGGDPGAFLGGTTTELTDVNGNAVFTDLTVDKVGTAYSLVASDPDVSGTLPSDPFDVTPGNADHLAFDQQPPASVQAGDTFTPAVTVDVLDSKGNLVTGATNQVSLGLNGPGSLTGGDPVAAVGGVATFSSLSVDTVGSSDTLTASASGLTGDTSDSFDVTVGPADHMVFTTQPPASVQSDQTIPVTVQVLDVHDNPVAGSTVSLTLSGGDPDATLAGDTAKLTNPSGDAIFTDLSVDKVGTGYTLVASDPAITGTTPSSAFRVTPGAPDHLTFTTQPVDGAVGQPLQPIVVAVQDSEGNQIVGTGKAVLSFANNPGGATLGGDLNKSPSPTTHDWHFTELTINKPAIGYTLTVTAMGLTSAPSSPFTVKGTPKLTISVNHGTIVATSKVTVTVVLTGHAAPCNAHPTVSYIFASDPKTEVPLGEVKPWMPAQCKGTLTLPRSKSGQFVAHVDGDGPYNPADTQTPAVLHVQALVTDILHGGYATRSGYRLFHYQRSCPPAPHKLCPLVSAKVLPPKIGKTVHFYLQALLNGKWVQIASSTNVVHSNGETAVIWFYKNSSVKGIPLRTRAWYGGDSDNLSRFGPWRYFKITS